MDKSPHACHIDGFASNVYHDVKVIDLVILAGVCMINHGEEANNNSIGRVTSTVVSDAPTKENQSI